MPAGDVLTADQRARIEHAVDTGGAAPRGSRSSSGWVGSRAAALRPRRCCAARGASAHDTVLVAVDPLARALEIVTGSRASTVLDDRACALASLTMTTSFAAGDLVGGVCRQALQTLTDHRPAHGPPPPRHLCSPSRRGLRVARLAAQRPLDSVAPLAHEAARTRGDVVAGEEPVGELEHPGSMICAG